MGKQKDSESDFSEEDKLLRKRDPRNTDDPRNKLKLGEFHRNNISKKKRKPSLKKKLRDALRMAERVGLPEAIKSKKEEEAKELKKDLKRQKEALKFETRYKKIKFTGKSVLTMQKSAK
jgi:pantoate kinase